ncbi:MAG: F0F1 ATP synthase subunit A [Firmicutes bacterium]|nr:F0F1 ATP synthase subunit A [Bacillota bacterium]
MYRNTTLALAAEEGEHSPFSIAPKREVFNIGGLSVSETMFSGFLTVVLLVGFFLVVRIFFIPRWGKEVFKKSGFRLFLEKLVTMFDSTAKEKTGRFAGFVSVLYLGLSSYICVATLLELFGLRPATTDLNLTFTLGIITFVMIFTLGLAKQRRRRLLHYLNPLNIVTDTVVPFAFGVRLFASVFSGFIIMELLYSNIFLSVITPVVASVMLTLLHAGMQAFIFMYLSMSFIEEAVHTETHSTPLRN